MKASESRMQGVQAGQVAGGRGRGARFRHLYERRLGSAGTFRDDKMT